MVSIDINAKQGLTQALRDYANKNNLKAADGSGITQIEWDATIAKLKSIQDSRANAQPQGASIFKTDVNIVKQGKVEFSDAEFKEILTAMGLSSETTLPPAAGVTPPAGGTTSKADVATPPANDSTPKANVATPPANAVTPKVQLESNLNVNFVEWAKNGYKLIANGEDPSKVKDLRFVEDDYDTALELKDDKATKEAYIKGLYKLTNQHIKLADKDSDSKISLDEYIAKEAADQQSVNVGFKLTGNVKSELKNSFENMDIDGDGSLNKDELASGYGVFDLDEKGKMNGRISLSAFANYSQQMGTKGFADAAKYVHNMFFGE